MFKIVPNPTFACQVPLRRPDSEVPVRVGWTFRHKTAAELAAWMRRAADGEYPSDVEFIAEVTEGWGAEILGADDKPLPYSAQALAQLLDAFPGAGVDIVTTYRRRLGDARLGN